EILEEYLSDIEDELNQKLANNILIYPNPGKGLYEISLGELIVNNCQLELYNNIGELILKTPIYSTKTTVNITNLPSGILLFRITNDNVCYNKMVLKE
ncbi:MAG: T9SS type A sorting domain-containing protein, partial [Bacteroidales bacterium]|nr:T9SS type A sorting domain-containing protein [Bacteroidales bacterium]